MESKFKKKSINTVIYLLLAAMLVCMVLVSVYTVASKRKGRNEETEGTVQSGQIDTKNDPAGKITTEESGETLRETEKSTESASAVVTEKAAEVGGTAVEDDEKPMSAAEHYFVMPVDGFISKAFEVDVPVWSATMCDYRAHTGADIASPIGTEVIAASSGRVCKVWSDPMMGRSVTIDHGDDIYTTYMNLGDEVLVSVGDKVGMGQAIGAVGSTSLTEVAEEPHIHLEMKIGGKFVDPLEYMNAGEYKEFEE